MADDKIRISWDDVQSTQVNDGIRQRAAVTGVTTPAQSRAISPTYSATLNNSRKSAGRLYVPWVICGVLLLLMVSIIIILLFISRNTSGNAVTRIETVLRQDKVATIGAQSVAEVVARMRAIDLSDCPDDFRSVYLTHIHAWEMLAAVESEVSSFKKNNDAGAMIVESVIRGVLGDPFGKAIETLSMNEELQQKLQTAGQQVRDTYFRVEETAVAHGAELPTPQ